MPKVLLWQEQRGLLDFPGLGLPLATSIPAIVRGKRHFQQMSVMGFKKRPEQLACAGIDRAIKQQTLTNV